MSDINEYLNDVKEEMETSSSDSRSQAINNGMLNLRKKIRDVEIQTESVQEPQEETQQPEYDKIALADEAVSFYRNNIQEKKEKVDIPCTKAGRVETKARIQSLTGLHSGNSGKTSPVPMDNPGKSGNTKGFDSGNVVIPPLSMEEYREQVFASFGLTETKEGLMKAGREQYKKEKEEGRYGGTKPSNERVAKLMKKMNEETEQDGPKPTPKQRRGAVRNIQQNINSLQNKEDDGETLSKKEKQQLAFQKARQKAWSEGVVEDLEDVLLELDDTSWQSIDKAMRELCREHNITPKELHKQFKAEHGMIPDEWIKEQEVTEDCGWFPLDEVTRINKVGMVYDVTFIFRGGTSRVKFFWPSASRPSKADMQLAVDKLYPKGKLITYYPSQSSGDNYMVVVPPMTENYEITNYDTWAEMPEELNEIYHQICEEVGEPTSVPMLTEEDQIIMWVEDHDTGEELEVVFEANKSGDSGLHDWFNKSKASDGTPGWVQLGGKYAGKPCARQPGQKTKPKCGSSKMKRDLNKDEEQAAFRRKNKEDGNPDRRGKAKNVATEEFVNESEYWDGPPKGAVKGHVGNRYGGSKVDPESEKRAKEARERAARRPLDARKDTPEKAQARDDAKKGQILSIKKKNEEFMYEDDMKGMTVKSGHKRSAESGAGLTQKGVEAYRRKNPGSKLKTAVTTPPSKLKPGSKAAGRRKSFCARSRGWTGERGKAARRRWNC